MWRDCILDGEPATVIVPAMSRRRAAVLLLAIGTAWTTACASSKSAAGDDPGVLVAPTKTIGRFAITNTYASIGTAVPVPPDSAYQILKRVYTILEIPVSEESQKDHSVGNESLKVRRRLAGLAMQTVLDCGDKMGLPNAENWDISMALFSSAQPDGQGGSQVTTRIQAMGHDPSVSNSHWVACETTSGLEEKIADMVKSVAASK
jgi:hypothetical protein